MGEATKRWKMPVMVAAAAMAAACGGGGGAGGGSSVAVPSLGAITGTSQLARVALADAATTMTTGRGPLGQVGVRSVALDPQAGFRLADSTIFILLGWLFFCMTPMAAELSVANWAHAVGLVAGMAASYAGIQMRS